MYEGNSPYFLLVCEAGIMNKLNNSQNETLSAYICVAYI